MAFALEQQIDLEFGIRPHSESMANTSRHDITKYANVQCNKTSNVRMRMVFHKLIQSPPNRGQISLDVGT